MKRIILVPIFLLALTSFMHLNAQWAKTYGGVNHDYATFIQQTSDGGYIVAGYTESFGARARDVWVLKLSSTGNIEWQHAYGGIRNEYAYFIQQTSDGGYIVAGLTFSYGTGSRDGWILKLSTTGDIEWQRSYGGEYPDCATFIQQTSDGGYIAAGFTDPFGAGYNNIWVLRLSSTGDIEWQRTYGGSGNDHAQFIQQTSDGGYIVAGFTESFGAGGRDIWILKLSSTGNIEWQGTYGGGNYDYFHSIQQTSDGGYIVAGCTYSFGAGSNDGWVLKLSSTGDIEWQRTYGGVNHDCARSVQQTSDNGYIVTGHTESFGAGSFDIWVLKLDSTGYISPSCGFMGSSNATITYPSVYPEDTYVTPKNTFFTSLATSSSPQDTDATVYLIWSAQEYTLTVSANPGGTIDPDPDTYTYNGGTRVTITAIPDSGYAFSGWSGDASGTENPITITIDKDKLITANFGWEYTLTIAAGEDGTTYPAPGNYSYAAETEVSITAIPGTGYAFSGWAGDVPQGSENDNPITITVDSDKSITANFALGYVLTITSGRGGTTDPAPGSYTYGAGIEVSIKAIPNEGYEFSEWSGDASGKENPITIFMDKDEWIIAIFTATGEAETSSWEMKCFIATAAYNSPLHPHVRILRDFRDKYLMTGKLGRKLVEFYYRYSPFVANLIAKQKALKVAVRISLLPMIALSYSLLHFGPIITGVIFAFIFVFPIFFVWYYRRRVRISRIRIRKVALELNGGKKGS